MITRSKGNITDEQFHKLLEDIQLTKKEKKRNIE